MMHGQKNIKLGILISFKICYETQRVVCHC